MPAAYRYVIIGTGVAAIAAVEAIRREDPRNEILLIGEESAGYYSRPGLAYYINGEVPEKQLFPLSAADFKQRGVKRLHARVVQIDPDAHQVLLHNQTAISYNRLLIATGAWAMRLPVPGSELPGVIKLDNLEDARQLLKLARRGATAVVVGGGITALEIAEALLKRGMHTHYILRSGRYWSSVLDEVESQIIEKRLQAQGLQFHFRQQVSRVIGRSRVSAVQFKDDTVLKCDLLAIAIGVVPRKELAEAAQLRTERGILVDETQQTSHPDIYAAGDAAQVFDPISGQAILDSLWNPARQQGLVAGSNMAGQHRVYSRPAPINVTRLADIPITIIGAVGAGADQDLLSIARGDSESWRLGEAGASAGITTTQAVVDINRLRILVGSRSLLGAVVMGDQSLTRLLQKLIDQQVDITAIREQLFQPEARLHTILSDFANRTS